MKDLFSRIARQLPENLTTEVLNYVLQNSTSCLTKFLKLLNTTAKPESISSKTQYSANGGFVDLELESKDKSTIIFVENKPWSTSYITNLQSPENQLACYGDVLETTIATEKILCLLATTANKQRLLALLGSDEKGIIDFFAGKNIVFKILTWEEVFDTFADKGTEANLVLNGSQYDTLLGELRSYILASETLPAEIINDLNSFKDHFASFYRCAGKANSIIMNSNANIIDRGCSRKIAPKAKPLGDFDCWYNCWYGYSGYIAPICCVYGWGPNLDDCRRLFHHDKTFTLKHPYTFWIIPTGYTKDDGLLFQDHIEGQLQKNNCFLSKSILLEQHFVLSEESWADVYTKPLDLQFTNFDEIAPDMLASAVLKIVNELIEAGGISPK